MDINSRWIAIAFKQQMHTLYDKLQRLQKALSPLALHAVQEKAASGGYSAVCWTMNRERVHHWVPLTGRPVNDLAQSWDDALVMKAARACWAWCGLEKGTRTTCSSSVERADLVGDVLAEGQCLKRP